MNIEAYTEHVTRFEKEFTNNNRLPRDRHWRPYRFAVRNVILALLALRYEVKNNVIEVDVALSDDPEGIEGYSGTKIITIFMLSEAYKSGSSMGIRFTSDFGKENAKVPSNIDMMAYEYGVELKNVSEDIITPKEARHLYLALTEFSEEAEKKVMELSIADVVTPERVCYMVHHLTYTKDEMESILLGTEFPEHILLGKITPKECMLYQDVMLRTRDVLLGGILDRKLKLKEVLDEEGNAIDLEANDRLLEISFDPRFFAKRYEILEETPIPWCGDKSLVLEPGEKAVVLLRARNRADFEQNFKEDFLSLKALQKSYTDKGTNIFLLVPRDVLEFEEKVLDEITKKLVSIGVTLLVCPESTSLLDDDAIRRLRESETMRHSVGEGEDHYEISPAKNDFDYNSSQITFVSLPKDLTIGRLSLDKLLKQAIYDERELFADVAKHIVRSRYSLVCNRIQFLANQALHEEHGSLTLSENLLRLFANLWPEHSESVEKNRLLPIFWTPKHIEKYVGDLKSMFPKNEMVSEILDFFKQSAKDDLIVVAVQNKHAAKSDDSDVELQKHETKTDDLKTKFSAQFVPDWVENRENLSFDEVVIKMLQETAELARKGQPNSVNLSEIPHVVLTKALRNMVFEDPKKVDNENVSVNIVYTDGSQARPFPLFCLNPKITHDMTELRNKRALKVGFISMRHPEMDHLIDHYWFKNIEVSRPGSTSSEIDEISYNITLKKLKEIDESGHLVNIKLYQTGFQAPLIGFWRAVTEFLIKKQGTPPKIQITPMYYDRYEKRYKPGKSWY